MAAWRGGQTRMMAAGDCWILTIVSICIKPMYITPPRTSAAGLPNQSTVLNAQTQDNLVRYPFFTLHVLLVRPPSVISLLCRLQARRLDDSAASGNS
jgi:hypothetical protein